MRLFKKKKPELFSSLEEEKILSDLCQEISVHHSYIDIGASDGVKWSNTYRLALQGWQGLCFEYDFKKVHNLTRHYQGINNVFVCHTKVTPENILSFLHAYNIPKEFGVLNLDIDSYDYFVLDKLFTEYRPTICMVEINEKIPPPLSFTVLYNASHSWDGSHFYGQSISQLEKLCNTHNYSIAHLEYNNLFLIAKEHYTKKPLTAKEAFEQGYLNRADRKTKFPWNADMEEILTLSSYEAKAYLDKKFEAHKGKYQLTIR